ncbi:MAG TPA: enolase C-terminal domain-like protein [Polyangiaceae bacterium]|jgi:O-succinylbenzoate synthase
MEAVTLRVSLERTRRPLSTSAENAHVHWSAREHLMLRVEDSNGSVGLGECSPLPSFSPDTLSGCEAALRELDLGALSERVDVSELHSELARASELIGQQFPAARCALETALLDLWSRALGIPAWQAIAALPKPGSPRSIAGLLANLDTGVEDMRDALEGGLRTFKFKIGRSGAFARELAILRELRAVCPAHGRLRIDANRALDRAAIAQLTSFELEWLEEPCAPDALPTLADLALPLALDESLCGLSPTQAEALWDHTPNLRAIVLKPMLLGVSACLELARRAKLRGLAVVLSHTFDDRVALGVSATLALGVGSRDVAHGLDLAGARFAGPPPLGFARATLEPWDQPGLAVSCERP